MLKHGWDGLLLMDFLNVVALEDVQKDERKVDFYVFLERMRSALCGKSLEVGGVPACRGQVGLQFKLGWCASKYEYYTIWGI